MAAELREVVAFAVVGDPDGLVFISQGLFAACQVDNGQAAMGEATAASGGIEVGAGVVRATMGEGIGHESQFAVLDGNLAIKDYNACNTTHKFDGCIMILVAGEAADLHLPWLVHSLNISFRRFRRVGTFQSTSPE